MEIEPVSIEKKTLDQRCREMLISLRQIIQAIDLHSRDLRRRFGITGPQLIILNEVATGEDRSVTDIAKSISLSQATVTDILNRLEKMGLIIKKRSDSDKRKTIIMTAEKGQEILSMAPPALQEIFIERFTNLAEWEQLMILSSLKRIIDLMAAEKIEAPPLLAAEPINQL